jgi:hypothetical protein
MQAQVPTEPRWLRLQPFLNRCPVGAKTRAYALLNEGKLRAKKAGGTTLWEVASGDEYLENLPDYTAKAA